MPAAPTDPPTTYSGLLRRPGAAGFFTAAALGRTGIAMTSLGLVWLVHGASGSFGAAGTVTGAFAVAEAVGGPQLARLVDRRGQARVLPAQLSAHALAVGVLVALVTTRTAPWTWPVAAVAAGASIPQLGALSSTRWAALLRSEPLALPTAFALESLVNALTYLVGPVLVSAVAASGHPAAASTTAAALLVGGGLALVAQRRTAPAPDVQPARVRRPRAHRLERSASGMLTTGFAVLVAVSLGIGAFFGATQVSLTASVVERGRADVAPLLFALSSGAGLVSGWVYGRRPRRAAPAVQLVVACAALALACAPLLVVSAPGGLAVAVVASGATVPPVLVLTTVMAETAVRPGVLTQALTWLNSASAAGTAAGGALAGRLVDAAGPRAGFGVAAAAGLVMVLAATTGRGAGRSAPDASRSVTGGACQTARRGGPLARGAPHHGGASADAARGRGAAPRHPRPARAG